MNTANRPHHSFLRSLGIAFREYSMTGLAGGISLAGVTGLYVGIQDHHPAYIALGVALSGIACLCADGVSGFLVTRHAVDRLRHHDA